MNPIARPHSSNESVMLTGVTVLDMCWLGPGLLATQYLRRLGARVIHLEPPGGNPAREFPEIQAVLNGGKESVVADLKREEDRCLAMAIARRSDVCVESWRPGVADRLGVGAAAIMNTNPEIVYCSLSGFGQTGPLRDRPGHDINYLAASGLLNLLSEETPRDFPLPLADVFAGMLTAMRIVAGVFNSRTTGSGIRIDASIGGSALDVVMSLGAGKGESPTAQFRSLPHYGVFRTRDGAWVTLGTTYEDHFWDELAYALGRPSWVGLEFAERQSRSSELREELTELIGGFSREDLESLLSDVETCWAFVCDEVASGEVRGALPVAEAEPYELGMHTEAVRREFSCSST